MSRRFATVNVPKVTLAHGGGGKAMKDLIDDVFVRAFDNPLLAPLDDQARIELGSLCECGDRLAFTTDSYVVDPLFFPGGDIGKLSVCGTINDLAVGGARPLYLSCSAVIEEGTTVELLRKVARSMADAAREAGVSIVTGDTKVVNRGACDKLFLTTTGIGIIPAEIILSADQARVGDSVVVNGMLGDHGAAIMAARGEFSLETTLESDCAALHDIVRSMLTSAPNVRCIRDATRGGVATVLNEITSASNIGIEIDEKLLPIRPEVTAFCEILGLDPLYLANEGKFVAIVPDDQTADAIAALRDHSLGRNARCIGRVVNAPFPRVVMNTAFGSTRTIDMLSGEQLPRIC